MKYIFAIVILLSGYYSFSYGIFQWKKEKNKLGAFGTILFSIVGTVIPVIFYLIRA
jgi:hypothetical protein